VTTPSDGPATQQPEKFARVGVVVLGCTAAATLAHAAVRLIGDDILPPFVAYYPAILIATLLNGVWAASLVAVLGAAVLWLAFPSPYFGSSVLPLTQLVNLIFYLSAAAVIVWTAELYRQRGYHKEPERVAASIGADWLANTFGRFAQKTSSQGAAYLFAVASVVVATLVRFAFGWMGNDTLLFASYYPAVLVVTLTCGAVAGGFTAVLSVLVVWWAFVSPQLGFTEPTRGHFVGFAYFLAMAAVTIWIAESYRRLLRRLHQQDAEHLFRLREVQHRGRNNLAVVQAIVGQALRGHQHYAEKINNRIRALAVTDDLISQSADQSVTLKDIVEAELAAYGTGRITVQGKSLRLIPVLARAATLLVHELATNAAKYGSLSTPEASSRSRGLCRAKGRTSGGSKRVGRQ
jgi:K+-sensing histidine kinase KdpD